MDTGQPFYSNVFHGHFALSSSQNEHSHEKIGEPSKSGGHGLPKLAIKIIYGHIIQNTPSLLDGKRRRGTLTFNCPDTINTQNTFEFIFVGYVAVDWPCQ